MTSDDRRYELSSTRMRWRAARRAAVAPRSGRSANASAWRTRAAEVTSTLAPATRRPPGQAEVVAEEDDRLVEPADLGEARRPHQRERARHREHVAEAVVLALVELAPLDERQGDADLVDGHAELREAPRGRPTARAWAHDVGVPLVGRGDEGADRPRVGRGVVVAEHVELRAGHEVEHQVGGLAEAGVAVDPPDPAAGNTAWTRSVGSSAPVSTTSTSRFG